MNIQDVAQAAGVSVATVSRVFNLPDKVTPATRAHVAQVARTLGYQPNASARTLRTQRSRVVGVVLPTLTNPVFAECLEGIARAAAAAGYAILPFTTDYRLDQEERAASLLIAGNVDGMILTVSNPGTSWRCAAWQTRDCPMCWSTTGMPSTLACRWTASRPWPNWWRALRAWATGAWPW